MPTFKELLGTDNKKEQEQRILELLAKEANPEVMLTLQYNQLKDDLAVQLSGGDAPYEVIFRMLELASQVIRQQELVAALKQQESVNEKEE